MSLYGLIIIACGLAMVNFSMAFLSSFYRCQDVPGAMKIGLIQATFQAGLYALGWLLAIPFQRWLVDMTWPLAIFIMVMLGLKMLLLSRKARPPEKAFDLGQLRILIGVAFASGINGFIIGMATGLVSTDLYPAILIIALASFALSVMGVVAGKVSGNIKFGQVSEALGGFLIIFTAVILLLEFTGIIL